MLEESNSVTMVLVDLSSLQTNVYTILRLKPQLHQAYDQVTTKKWANRRKNVRLVAEVLRLVAVVVGDRMGQISRSKVVVMFKTQSRLGYDLPAIEKCCNRGQIEERAYDWPQRSYDWSQRSWVIARRKSVATR